MWWSFCSSRRRGGSSNRRSPQSCRPVFNFFFLPPFGTFTIADPQNWIAFSAFLVTAVVTSQLSSWARARNIEALQRQRDLERLYAFSRAFLLSEGREPVEVTIARRIAETFQLSAVAVYDRRTDRIGLGGAEDLADIDDRLRDVARQAVPFPGQPTELSSRR